MKGIDIEQMVNDMHLDDLQELGSDNVNNLLKEFEDHIITAMDLHTPIKTIRVQVRDKNPWYDQVLRDQKKIMRKREQIWRKYKQDHQLKAYQVERAKFYKQLRMKKGEKLLVDITEHRGDSKYLYKLTWELCGIRTKNPLPASKSDQVLAENFADFLINKIKTIRDNLASLPLYECVQDQSIGKFTNFHPVSEEDVAKIIKGMTTKTCENDPISTKILKDNLPKFVGSITKIVNLSLEHGVFADKWKVAILRPLLKKSGLELVCSNYRPVSNLPFLSKVVEKIATSQVVDHCFSVGKYPKHQSAYLKNRSCETALLYLVNSILWSMEAKDIAVVVAMDLSAAFDTVDHDILLQLLENQYGISGNAIKWFDSYLRPRSFKVNINDKYSSERSLDFSVPQGSAGGPVFYNLYAAPLVDIIPEEIDLIGFADDHTLIKSFTPGTENAETVCRSELEACMSSVNKWMGTMRLKMNPSKTELIYFGNKRQLEKCRLDSMEVENSIVNRSNCITLLGCSLDKNLSFLKHINNQCCKAMINFYRIKSIRPYITKEACEVLVHGLIMSHLDYGNCLLYGLPSKLIWKFQRIQNMSAKLILNLKTYDASVTRAKMDLHWLPITERIEYKILILVFKCIWNEAPPYLQALINQRHASRNTRSSNTLTLEIPFVRKSTHAWRSFSLCGPRLWNSLPEYMRNILDFKKFKTSLKTYLFKRCYNV